MEISACPKCDSKDIHQRNLRDGTLTGCTVNMSAKIAIIKV